MHFFFYKLAYAPGAKSQNIAFVTSVCSVSGICRKLIRLQSYLEKLSSHGNLGSPLPFPGFLEAILICDLLSP